jgi:hypothetical protein
MVDDGNQTLVTAIHDGRDPGGETENVLSSSGREINICRADNRGVASQDLQRWIGPAKVNATAERFGVAEIVNVSPYIRRLAGDGTPGGCCRVGSGNDPDVRA